MSFLDRWHLKTIQLKYDKRYPPQMRDIDIAILSKTESVKFHWFSVKFHWLKSWEVSHWESVKMYKFIQWKCYHWLDQWKRLNESVVRITDWISEINHSLNYWLKNLRVLKKYFKWTLLQVAMKIFYYEIKQFIRNKNVIFHFI